MSFYGSEDTEISLTQQEQAEPAPVPSVFYASRWKRFLHWEHLGLLVILAVTFTLHFIAIERPPTIVWDEKWYVGDARSIISRSGELRPEHPPLAKLFIVAGEYIFNGFKAPEKDTGANVAITVGSLDVDTLVYVNDASLFEPATTIRIGAEQMDIKLVDPSANSITVERGAGGSSVSSHSAQEPIYVYTDNAFGWRFFSVIFGTLGIVIFYFICRSLKFSWKATMLATFLFAFEDMTFVHSGLALLDVYMVTFMLAAVYFYLKEGYLLSGICVALSAQCKLAGVLIFIALFLHWAIYRRDKWPWFAGSLATAAFCMLFFTVVFDYFVVGSFENPFTRIEAMLNGTAANLFTDPKLSISSRPWTWIYPQWIQLYYNSPNVPFLVYSYDPQHISFISSTIQIFIVPVMAYMAYKAVKGSRAAGLLLLWFFATYLVWIPLDIVTNRVTFVFYFLSTTPAVCLALGMALADMLEVLKNRRARSGRLTPGVGIAYGAIVFYLLLHFAIFIVFNPAIPTIIKTWLPPFTIGISPSSEQSSSVTTSMLPLLFFTVRSVKSRITRPVFR